MAERKGIWWLLTEHRYGRRWIISAVLMVATFIAVAVAMHNGWIPMYEGPNPPLEAFE